MYANMTTMHLTRTTLRLDTSLKKAAERQALEQETTLQAIFNDALRQYFDKKAKKKARDIVFLSQDLGEPLDRLTRDDYYSEP